MVGLLRIARSLDEEQQGLVPGCLTCTQHSVDPWADVVPDLRPYLARRAAQGPWVLAAQGVPPVGGIAEERQLGPPRHPHGEARRQQNAYRGPQTLRPVCRWPEGVRRPVDRGKVLADLGVRGEHIGCGCQPVPGAFSTHRSAPLRPRRRVPGAPFLLPALETASQAHIVPRGARSGSRAAASARSTWHRAFILPAGPPPQSVLGGAIRRIGQSPRRRARGTVTGGRQ